MFSSRNAGRLLTCAAFAVMSAVLAACTAISPSARSGSEATATPAPSTSSSAKPAAPANEFSIAAVGDIMLGGTAQPEMQKYGYDYPFDRTREILRRAQIVFCNLEGPLTDDGRAEVEKKYLFRSPPEKVAPALARAGFNVASLANNHTLDYGFPGLKDTLVALEKAGIQPVGAGRNLAQARAPVYLKANGVTVAFLAYSLVFPEEFWAGPEKPGTAFGHERYVRADVAAARRHADIVVVSFHWGREGTTEPRDYQVLLAHAAIDAGASVVLGHHPHILQGVERYKDGVIAYSLGNFAFGSYSKTATRSVIALFEFRQRRLRELRLVPIDVDNVEVVFQPRPLVGPGATEVVEQLARLSRERGTLLENRNGNAVLSLNADPGS